MTTHDDAHDLVEGRVRSVAGAVGLPLRDADDTAQPAHADGWISLRVSGGDERRAGSHTRAIEIVEATVVAVVDVHVRRGADRVRARTTLAAVEASFRGKYWPDERGGHLRTVRLRRHVVIAEGHHARHSMTVSLRRLHHHDLLLEDSP